MEGEKVSVSNTKKHTDKKLFKIRRKRSKKSKKRARRRQSKRTFLNTFRNQRFNTATEDLCSAVNLVKITDFEHNMPHTSINLPPQIVDWQKQQQIAYWKSRAISLKIENRMLREHLRGVYAQAIKDNQMYEQDDIVFDENLYEETETSNFEEVMYDIKKMREDNLETEKIPQSKLPDPKSRDKEMKLIYGEKSQTISGMETALQLNFDRYMEKSNAMLWPAIPLRLN